MTEISAICFTFIFYCGFAIGAMVVSCSNFLEVSEKHLYLLEFLASFPGEMIWVVHSRCLVAKYSVVPRDPSKGN